MKGLLFLLFCIAVLGAVLGGTQTTPRSTADLSGASNTNSASTASQTPPSAEPSSVTNTATLSPPTVSSLLPDSQPATTTSTPMPFDRYRKECLPVLMAASGLIIVCAFLLVSTLLLMWKVCQLNRRIKMLSDNADLISTTEYWMGTTKRDKNTPETEAKENTMLMADIGQAQEEVGNGTTKDEGEKVNKDEQTGEENRKKVEDTTKSEQASPTTENTPKEEATDSQSTKTSSAEATEEPKEMV